MTQTIGRSELTARLDKGEAITLVEALPITYFNEAHLPNALQMNHDEVDAKAASLLPDKSAVIVVYCSSADCANSSKAAQRLQQLGYRRVFKYTEGKQDWLNAGLPVQKSA